ncbi:MAG: sulfur relay protein DsrC [Nocardioides sp.]|nr:sulfur relay protein DsrC [Nocardioides sp.]
MPTNTINGHTFEVDGEGFFTVRSQWSEDLAHELAPLIGVELDEEHLAPLRFMRADAGEDRNTPTLRRMQTVGGFEVRDLYRLSPGKPAKKMAWLAGLPKPVGCV